MKTLESLVPTLDLCKQIPAGKFGESSLIWFIWECNGKLDGYVVPREMKDQFVYALSMLLAVLHKELPAPTLEEILEELECYEPVTVSQWRTRQSVVTCQVQGEEMEEKSTYSAATAALKLWLELNKGEKEMTNADKIRSISNEELAEFMSLNDYCPPDLYIRETCAGICSCKECCLN